MITYSLVNLHSSYNQKYMYDSVVTIPDFAMRYVSRYLDHDAIRIAILVYDLPCHSNRCASFLYLFPSGCRLGTAEQDCNSVIRKTILRSVTAEEQQLFVI